MIARKRLFPVSAWSVAAPLQPDFKKGTRACSFLVPPRIYVMEATMQDTSACLDQAQPPTRVAP
jgi:hypothetical protein